MFPRLNGFKTNLRAIVEGRAAFKVDRVIGGQWEALYNEEPPIGAQRSALILRLSYELALRDYKASGLDPSSQFKKHYSAASGLPGGADFARAQFNEASRLLWDIENRDPILNGPYEGQYPKEATTIATKKTAAPKKKTTTPKAAPKPDATPKARAKKEPGKMAATARACELLIEQKYTDDEMVKILLKEYPDRNEKQCKVYVSVQRSGINRGANATYELEKGQRIEKIVK